MFSIFHFFAVFQIKKLQFWKFSATQNFPKLFQLCFWKLRHDAIDASFSIFGNFNFFNFIFFCYYSKLFRITLTFLWCSSFFNFSLFWTLFFNFKGSTRKNEIPSNFQKLFQFVQLFFWNYLPIFFFYF